MSKDELEMPYGQEIYSPLLIGMEIYNLFMIKYDLLAMIDPLEQNSMVRAPNLRLIS